MREAAASLKSDLEAGKKLKILDMFVLKLPNVDSHRFHLTEGEVNCMKNFYVSILIAAFMMTLVSEYCI